MPVSAREPYPTHRERVAVLLKRFATSGRVDIVFVFKEDLQPPSRSGKLGSTLKVETLQQNYVLRVNYM